MIQKRLIHVALFPLLILALIVWTIKYIYNVFVNPDRAWVLAISVDQTANTAFNGHEDETISSRAGRHCPESGGLEEDREAWACLLCRFLDRLDPDHCRKSIGV